jgi:hypothetical protein
MTILPNPDQKLVKKYLRQWETDENLIKYPIQEAALNRLYGQLCPSHKDISDVILKVSALNDFYSTNLFNTHAVAEHIISIDNIENRLKKGDTSLVNEIALVNISGKEKNFYSFASKYCAHHKPSLYPIYDRYVVKMLLEFNKRHNFYHFVAADLKNYTFFIDVIRSFQNYFNLKEFSLRDIDLLLWLMGKEYFPINYKHQKIKLTKKNMSEIKMDNSEYIATAKLRSYTIMRHKSGTIELYDNGVILKPVLPSLRQFAKELDISIYTKNDYPLNTRRLGELIINKLNRG